MIIVINSIIILLTLIFLLISIKNKKKLTFSFIFIVLLTILTSFLPKNYVIIIIITLLLNLFIKFYYYRNNPYINNYYEYTCLLFYIPFSIIYPRYSVLFYILSIILSWSLKTKYYLFFRQIITIYLYDVMLNTNRAFLKSSLFFMFLLFLLSSIIIYIKLFKEDNTSNYFYRPNNKSVDDNFKNI